MKYIKQNIKRALSWLTTLTLTLAILPALAEPASASDIPPPTRTTPLNLADFGTTALIDEHFETEGWKWERTHDFGSFFNHTLTLKNFRLSVESIDALLTRNDSVNIVLEGDNYITATGTGRGINTAGTNGSVSFSGNGSLTINSGGAAIFAHNTAGTAGSVSINGCTLNINSGGRGIDARASVSITNGASVDINAASGNGIHIEGTGEHNSMVTITDSTVKVNATNGGGISATSQSVMMQPARNASVTITNSNVAINGNGAGSTGIFTEAVAGFMEQLGTASITLNNSTVTASGPNGAFNRAPVISGYTNNEFTAWTNTAAAKPFGWGIGTYTYDSDDQFFKIEPGTWGQRAGIQTLLDTDEPEDIDVQARIVDIKVSVYRIDILWGAMKFAFDKNSGEWGYDDREYGESQGRWLVNDGEDDGEKYLDGKNNKVTVTNRSNSGVNVSFKYIMGNDNLFNNESDAINAVQGNFFEDNDDAVAAAEFPTDAEMGGISGLDTHLNANAMIPIESADLRNRGDLTTLPSADIFFAFSGTPDKDNLLSENFQKAGIITVTIEPNNN